MIFFTMRADRVIWESSPHRAMVKECTRFYIAWKGFNERGERRCRELRDSRVTAGKTAVGIASISAPPRNLAKREKKKVPVFIHPEGFKPAPIQAVRQNRRLPGIYRDKLNERTAEIKVYVLARAKKRHDTVVMRRQEQEALKLTRARQAMSDTTRYPPDWLRKKPMLQPWDEGETRALKLEFLEFFHTANATTTKVKVDQSYGDCACIRREGFLLTGTRTTKQQYVICKVCGTEKWVGLLSSKKYVEGQKKLAALMWKKTHA
jgi:hypothetical protein